VGGTIIHLISAGTSLVNLSGLRLLTLLLLLLQLLPPLLPILLYRFLRHTMVVSFNFRVSSIFNQLILQCIALLQVRVYLLLSVISLEYLI